MAHSKRHNLKAALCVTAAWVSETSFMMMTAGTAYAQAPSPLGANFGTEVTNIATVTYSLGDVTTSVITPDASFTIRPPAAPAQIDFLRLSETAPNPLIRQIQGSEFSPSGQIDGPFSAIGPAITTGSRVLDLSAPVPLIPASSFLANELMFIRVIDSSQNLDVNAIDSVVVMVTNDIGDAITIRLFESGLNSGEFYAYIPTSNAAAIPHDNRLSSGDNTQITAQYSDIFDDTDVVTDLATVNPLNRVFNSVTGEAVNGARITLINNDTGQSAEVFGIDGFSQFPSEVVSGEDVSDSGNLFYDNNIGQFRFPLVEPGNYSIQVEPPEGYRFSSVVDANTINQSINAAQSASAASNVSANATGQASDALNSDFVILPISFGESVSLNSLGPLRFDIPLDPETNFTVSKSTDRDFGDIGDYVDYTVTIENRGNATVPALLHDILPIGFRYVPGSTRIEQNPVPDPQISADATELIFNTGFVTGGGSLDINYTLLIGPAAAAVSTQAVNSAVIKDGTGAQISNIARASLTLREDLLRSTSTIIGRISEQSCDGDQDWVRPVTRGIGVGGVRLYMETGAYVVSDTDGLFHFEGVTDGTHIVQVDKETLPQGYELMTCEENTRYAGSNESQFIDVQGGGIWRANFYLKQTGETAEEIDTQSFNDAKEHLAFDEAWLEQQNSEITWVYPQTDRTPSTSSTNIGIKHGRGQKISLRVNDRDVPAYHYVGRDANSDRSVMLSRWRGIAIEDGRNVVIATVTDQNGTVIKTLREEIWFARVIARANPVVSESVLIADGRTTPEIAIRLEDQSGRPVHKGRITTINLEPPYRLFDASGDNRIREQSEDLIAPLSARQDLSIGADGILRVKLEPTLRTGKVTVIATLDNGRQVPIYMYLEPEKRDWIIVGLAEGSAGYEAVRGNQVALETTQGNSANDIITDGRVALFAKGLIKGNWLLTLAVDTNRSRGNRDGTFRDEIDPNAFYTLYGDRSYQEFEGNSRAPVYVKLEKRQAYALFGDYETNITEGRLTAYNRRFTGFKGEYLGENIQILGFAAQTNQGFVKDELPADGTSGTYQLSRTPILSQSEQITIETRDRFRPDIVVEQKTLVRFLDYTLDYLTGQLIFRLPVEATDASLNPNVIVVDYETSEDAERNLSFGGRVQGQILGDKVQIGSSFVHEDGSALRAGAQQSQIGIDVIADITDNTQIRAEYAITDNQTSQADLADAALVEIIHNSEKFSGEAFYREEAAGFGLGQRASNTNGARRYGARGNYILSEFEDAQTGRRGQRSIDVQAFREENLSTGDTRNTAEVLASHQSRRLNVSAGLRAVRDNLAQGVDRDSTLAIARASYLFPKLGTTLQVSHEQPINGDDNVSDFTQRSTIGIDKNFGQIANLSLRYEINDGFDTRSENAVIGLTATPWNGTTFTANSDAVTNDNGRRLGATVGVDQIVKIDKNWALSGGLRSRRILESDAEFLQVTPDAAISPFEINETFTSAYIGAAYRNASSSASVRLETRQSQQEDSYILAAGAARELTQTLSFAGAARGQLAQRAGEADQRYQFNLRLGTAWRPRDENTVIFNRLDVNQSESEIGTGQTKLVNNLAVNGLVNARWQLSGNWGIKYTRTHIGNQNLSNFVNLLGAETRYDITEKIDLGLRGQWLSSGGAAGGLYSFGPTIGFTPIKNVWINTGYNIEGFKDQDFEAANFSRRGAFIQMRLKFDQNTARGLLRRISPAASAVK